MLLKNRQINTKNEIQNIFCKWRTSTCPGISIFWNQSSELTNYCDSQVNTQPKTARAPVYSSTQGGHSAHRLLSSSLCRSTDTPLSVPGQPHFQISHASHQNCFCSDSFSLLGHQFLMLWSNLSQFRHCNVLSFPT